MIVGRNGGGPLLEMRVEVLARDVMLTYPKTLPADVSVDQVRSALSNDHVHMALLTDGPILLGTLVRADLPTDETIDGRALQWATLVGRTVSATVRVDVVHRFMMERDIRRIAVVDSDHMLLGLMCLKRHRSGFCSDDDVTSRSEDELSVWRR